MISTKKLPSTQNFRVNSSHKIKPTKRGIHKKNATHYFQSKHTLQLKSRRGAATRKIQVLNSIKKAGQWHHRKLGNCRQTHNFHNKLKLSTSSYNNSNLEEKRGASFTQEELGDHQLKEENKW
jgi:hypothetical protein